LTSPRRSCELRPGGQPEAHKIREGRCQAVAARGRRPHWRPPTPINTGDLVRFGHHLAPNLTRSAATKAKRRRGRRSCAATPPDRPQPHKICKARRTSDGATAGQHDDRAGGKREHPTARRPDSANTRQRTNTRRRERRTAGRPGSGGVGRGGEVTVTEGLSPGGRAEAVRRACVAPRSRDCVVRRRAASPVQDQRLGPWISRCRRSMRRSSRAASSAAAVSSSRRRGGTTSGSCL
jgi:hypothetical protein